MADSAGAATAETEIHHGNQFVKILRHGSWYFVASLLTKLAGLVLVPVYTRYLPPAEYGILGSLDAVSRLLPLFISLYLDASFIRFYYDDRRVSKGRVRTLYSTQFWFVATWGVGICAVGLMIAPFTIQSIVDVPFAPFMPLVFTAPLFTQLGIMGSQVMRADLKARQVSLVNIASFIATACVALILLIPFGYGVVSLMWGLVAGPFLSFIVFTAIGIRSGVLGWTFDWATLRRSLAFSIPLMPNVAGGWINGFSNRLILAYYGTLADVGLFTISAQIGLVMYFLTDAVTQVQDPIGMSALTADREAGKRQIAEFVSVFMWTVLALFLVLTLFAREAVSIVTPPSYHEAYVLVGVFALAYVAGAVYRVFTVVLMFHRRLWVIGAGAALSAVLNIGFMLVLIPRYGQAAAAASFLLSTVLYTGWIVWWSQRTDPVPLNWRALGPTFAGALVAVAGYAALELAEVETLVAFAAKVGLMTGFVGMLFVVPGLAPLRAGLTNQIRVAKARARRPKAR